MVVSIDLFFAEEFLGRAFSTRIRTTSNTLLISRDLSVLVQLQPSSLSCESSLKCAIPVHFAAYVHVHVRSYMYIVYI